MPCSPASLMWRFSGGRIVTLLRQKRHGKDAAEVRVNVVGPPGPPEGSMDITGIHKNGCKIAWKPPKDDGGSPIEHYVVEKYDTDTEIWSPVGTTPTCNIECKNLEPG